MTIAEKAAKSIANLLADTIAEDCRYDPWVKEGVTPIIQSAIDEALEKAKENLRGSRDGCMCYEKNALAIDALKGGQI